jgi:hypothetical protein
MQAVPAALVGDARAVEVRGGVVEREAAGELERLVVETGLVALDELERVRLVAAAEEGAAVLAARLGEAELNAPARDGLVEVGNSEGDVVDAAKT